MIRRQKTEDRGQRFCRGFAAQFSQVRSAVAGGFCLLSSVLCPLNAEELPDPTRPPASIFEPAVAGGAGAAPAGLQSIIISKTRRAAIIDGKTVELGGKHGDAKLIEVNEGGVVLRGAQGRQVMTLFPDVKMNTAKVQAGNEEQKVKSKPQSPSSKAQTEGRKLGQTATGEMR